MADLNPLLLLEFLAVFLQHRRCLGIDVSFQWSKLDDQNSVKLFSVDVFQSSNLGFINFY